jgi:DNA-binding response OmpR family regulator
MILAEDDHDVRNALAQMFSADGFDVLSVPSGDELVRALESARDANSLPYIVVTDQLMPGYTGIEVTRALRDNGWPVPVIIITAYGPEIERLGLEAGADLVFPKPLDTEDLRTAVWYWAQARGITD